MLISPIVNLFCNPWDDILSDQEVLESMHAVALVADVRLRRMIRDGEVEDGRDSLGVVLLDPTPSRSATSFNEQVLATIVLGPHGAEFVPNAAAKADAHARHGVNNGLLVRYASHCLGNGDFAWGNSAEYKGAIGGGSGLSVEQDGAMVRLMLEHIMETVRVSRDCWIDEQRRLNPEGHRWFNSANEPPAKYKAVLDLQPIATSARGV